MLCSNHRKPQGAPPVFSRKLIAGVFFFGTVFGTVFGTGLGYGFQKTVIISQLNPSAVAMNYERIHLGMTQTEARSILGPGTELSKSESSEVIEWQIPNGQTITAVFEDGQLIEKKQPGSQL